MEILHRIPLQDIPLEQFLTPTVAGSKTPRNHKRPLSPSWTTPFNPAKRRVLDAESTSFPNMHAMTPARPSRLGNEFVRHFGSPQGPLSPLSSRRCSFSREPYLKPTIESSTDPQSRHYPGFDIFRDNDHRRASPVPREPPLSDGDAQVDKSEEDKENMPLRRRAKKLCSKKLALSALEGSDVSYFSSCAQTSKAVRSARPPFSARQALR